MRYEGTVYRPPSEAYSLIIQATIGCAHNKCTFCSMYKSKNFRIRSLEEIYQDLYMARNNYKTVKRIFLADGDALAIKTDDLKNILLKIGEIFPECERVDVYGAPKDIIRKSIDELKELKKFGLGIIYLGVESGLEVILKDIKKGAAREEIVEAGRRVKESGIKLSVTLISGIGGQNLWKEHALESADVISKIDPDYLGLLTLMVEDDTELKRKVESGEFKLLSPKEVMLETKLLLENICVSNCVFRSNHASNYVPLGGTLPKEKDEIIKTIDYVLNDYVSFKPEEYRGL